MLVIIDQIPIESCDPNFDPGFIPGEAGVYDPYTEVVYSAYGLSVNEFEKRFNYEANLWNRDPSITPKAIPWPSGG